MASTNIRSISQIIYYKLFIILISHDSENNSTLDNTFKNYDTLQSLANVKRFTLPVHVPVYRLNANICMYSAEFLPSFAEQQELRDIHDSRMNKHTYINPCDSNRSLYLSIIGVALRWESTLFSEWNLRKKSSY